MVTVEIGDFLPMVPINSVVSDFKQLNNIPIRSEGTRTIFIRDIGSVEDGADLQTGYALVNGHRTVYIPVTKRADASTLAVVQAVKANLYRFQSVLPDDIQVSYQFDQSPYVTRAINGLFFRRGARRDTHRPDDPLVSARLAQRAGRGVEHSARGPGVGDSALGIGSDNQHHDFGWAGFGRRHPGRRSNVARRVNGVTGAQCLHYLVGRHVVGTQLTGICIDDDGALA